MSSLAFSFFASRFLRTNNKPVGLAHKQNKNIRINTHTLRSFSLAAASCAFWPPSRSCVSWSFDYANGSYANGKHRESDDHQHHFLLHQSCCFGTKSTLTLSPSASLSLSTVIYSAQFFAEFHFLHSPKHTRNKQHDDARALSLI